MKTQEESGVNTSVADWKPCTREEFDRLLHHYATTSGDAFGNDGITPKAYRLDRYSKAVIWSAWRDRGGSPIGSPVLMTMTHGDGLAPITFASLRYGVNAPPDLAYRTPEGELTDLGAGRSGPSASQDTSNPDDLTHQSAATAASFGRRRISEMTIRARD